MSATPIDGALCEALARRAAEGDAAAAKSLCEHLWPTWLRLCAASPALAALGGGEDHAHEVATRLFEKLTREGGARLALYVTWQERNPERGFDDWIRIVTANAARDYARQQRGDATHAAQGDTTPGRLLNEFSRSPLTERLGVTPMMTAAQTARQLLEFARAELAPDQIRALTLWLDGADFSDIDVELELAEDAGRKLVRSAIAVLRRHFVG